MSRQLTLAQRHEELLARSIRQRAELVSQVQAVRIAATPSHLATNFLATFCQHKLLIAGAALAVLVIKPRRILAGMKAGLAGWQMWGRFAPLLQGLIRRD